MINDCLLLFFVFLFLFFSVTNIVLILPFLVHWKKNFPVIIWEKENRGLPSQECHTGLLRVKIWTHKTSKLVISWLYKEKHHFYYFSCWIQREQWLNPLFEGGRHEGKDHSLAKIIHPANNTFSMVRLRCWHFNKKGGEKALRDFLYKTSSNDLILSA